MKGESNNIFIPRAGKSLSRLAPDFLRGSSKSQSCNVDFAHVTSQAAVTRIFNLREKHPRHTCGKTIRGLRTLYHV